MTIAACHVSPEGVVFGADSTTTITNAAGGKECHFDHAQKIFEVGGVGSSVGLVTWGMGSIGQRSHRAIASEVSRYTVVEQHPTMDGIANHLGDILWELYSTSYQTDLAWYKDMLNKVDGGHEPSADELKRFFHISSFTGGYCIGGRLGTEIECRAYVIRWHPTFDRSDIQPVAAETPTFWGVPQFIERLIFGADAELARSILKSGKWTGTEDELYDLLASNQLIHPHLLPLREAIDWIHTVIHTTIRAIKFAKQPHYCGGPIEIAVVSNDRPFRWVQHKELDSAIGTENR